MLLWLVLHLVIALQQVVVDNGIGTFAIKSNATVGSPQDDWHPLANIVEIQDAEQFVDFCLTHDFDRDRVGCTRLEDETKIASSWYQSSFVRRLGLVFQFACRD